MYTENYSLNRVVQKRLLPMIKSARRKAAYICIEEAAKRVRRRGNATFSGLLYRRDRIKEVKEPSVPCGVSFPLFFPLLEIKEAVGDRTRRQPRRECVSVSAVCSYLSLSQILRICQLPPQREPLGQREEVLLGCACRVAGNIGVRLHLKYRAFTCG